MYPIDGIIQLGISSMKTVLLERENYLMRFEFYRILSVHTCDADPSNNAIAESLGHSKLLSRGVFLFILLA